MKLIVNKTSVALDKNSVVNEGEFNVNICEFSFDETFEGTIKKAVFSNYREKLAYTVPILNGTCQIPTEVLRAGRYVMLGVYAYNLDETGKLKLRFSPTPTRFLVSPGSYREGLEPSKDVAVEKYDAYDSLLQDEIKRVDELVKDVYSRIENGEFTGEAGKDGAPGRSPYVGENGNWWTFDENGEPVDTGIKTDPGLSEVNTRLDEMQAQLDDFKTVELFTEGEWGAIFN